MKGKDMSKHQSMPQFAQAILAKMTCGSRHAGVDACAPVILQEALRHNAEFAAIFRSIDGEFRRSRDQGDRRAERKGMGQRGKKPSRGGRRGTADRIAPILQPQHRRKTAIPLVSGKAAARATAGIQGKMMMGQVIRTLPIVGRGIAPAPCLSFLANALKSMSSRSMCRRSLRPVANSGGLRPTARRGIS